MKLSRSSGDDLFQDGQTLEAHGLDFPLMISPQQHDDWRRFLVDTELAYVNEMRNYLRQDLKVHANIIDTQISYGDPAGLLREAGSDFTDDHDYWQHPTFPGRSWSASNWLIQNVPMTDALASGDGGTFGALAVARTAGKPFTVSEYNHPAPNDYQAEMFPEIVSFAALQDWDGVFPFDYGNYGGTQAMGQIQGFFDLEGNPAKEAFLPAASLIFRQGLIAPLAPKTTLHLPVDFPFGPVNTMTAWRNASDGKIPDIFTDRIETDLDPKATQPATVHSPGQSSRSMAKATKSPIGSQYVASGDAALAAAGYFGGQQINFNGGSFSLPEFGNNFAALMLTSLDAKPLVKSGHLLLTIVGKAENVGMGWNANRTTVGKNWGTGPAQVEVIPVTLSIANPHVKHAWALGPTGARIKELPVTSSGGKSTLIIGTAAPSIWYEIGE